MQDLQFGGNESSQSLCVTTAVFGQVFGQNYDQTIQYRRKEN